MKKTQVALAALALVASTAAMAEVKLYGAIDASVANTNAGTVFTAGDNVGSYLGVTGGEDLGNGLKAGFSLELGYNPGDGAMRNGGTVADQAVFNRAANVSLGTEAATLKIGLQVSPIIEAFGGGLNAYGGNAINVPAMGILGSYAAVTSATGFFIPNAAAVQFNSGGVSGNILRTIATETTTVQGDYTAARFTTNIGSASVNLGYESSKHSTAATPVNYTLIAITGSLPVTDELSINGGFTDRSNKDSGTSQSAVTFGASYKISDAWGVGINYAANDAATKSKMLGVGARYNLSKATAIFASYSDFSNNATGILQNGGSIESVSAGNLYSGGVVGLGISHAF